jgi:hypothetical protein
MIKHSILSLHPPPFSVTFVRAPASQITTLIALLVFTAAGVKIYLIIEDLSH